MKRKNTFQLITPPCWNQAPSKRLIRRCVRDLQQCKVASRIDQAAISKVRSSLCRLAGELARDSQECRVVISVLCDLAAQGWQVQSATGGIRIKRPTGDNGVDQEAERRRVRESHAVERDVQLRQRSVRQFIRTMETQQLGPKGWGTIFSLMRDGRDLADALGHARTAAHESGDLPSLQSIVDPYIQEVVPGDRCSETGLRLTDIWRYFRYTWANTYQTVPGRNLCLLIRDRAAECHPVIGIAALTSPVVHLKERDRWIGWAPKVFIEKLQNEPSVSWARWVKSSLNKLLREIYVEDLLADKIISRNELERPKTSTVERLRAEVAEARAAHRRYPDKRTHKNPDNGSKINWRQRAETYLFRTKRAEFLATLLEARLRLQASGFTSPSKSSLVKALESREGCKAIETIRRSIKAIYVGNHVLDISVCGAVPPYSAILGGKLVAMLLASPEVGEFYRRKYAKRGSIIASSMAGRTIRRKPELVLMTTTSLYGANLSQYTRISIPAKACGASGDASVRFHKLGKTIGQGSHHFSAATVDEIETLLAQQTGGRRVNSIFGEGVNPRLRKIRAGLDLCGFPPNYVLEHGNPRVIYGVALTSNFRDVLLGKNRKADYLLPTISPAETTKRISDYWCRRWLAKRIERDEVLAEVRNHTLIHPIRHGGHA